MSRIAIIVEGGLVQNIISDEQVNLDIYVVDYDKHLDKPKSVSDWSLGSVEVVSEEYFEKEITEDDSEEESE